MKNPRSAPRYLDTKRGHQSRLENYERFLSLLPLWIRLPEEGSHDFRMGLTKQPTSHIHRKGGDLLARGVRFFYIMGTVILILTLWSALQTPWDAIDRLNPDLGWALFLNLIVWLSVGVTEIAVGWLVDNVKTT